MQVFIVGSGKLANELLDGLTADEQYRVAPWTDQPESAERTIVVHAGSGRQVGAIVEYCQRTSSVLVELSTGSSLEAGNVDFPLVLCPNTNILMLKFMAMLECSGTMFSGCDIRITESHQASKMSVPGTAVSIAKALGVAVTDISSVRTPEQQLTQFHIPAEQLPRHAFHQIRIQDRSCSLVMETRVYGDTPYVSGVRQIIAAIACRVLEPRIYAINEFVENRWV